MSSDSASKVCPRPRPRPRRFVLGLGLKKLSLFNITAVYCVMFVADFIASNEKDCCICCVVTVDICATDAVPIGFVDCFVSFGTIGSIGTTTAEKLECSTDRGGGVEPGMLISSYFFILPSFFPPVIAPPVLQAFPAVRYYDS